jgi:hypothetical protein
MAIYTGDQPTIGTAVVNGCLVPANATLLDSLPSEAATYVFSTNFTLVYNSQVVSFRPGLAYSMDAALLAALTAAGAPIFSA